MRWIHGCGAGCACASSPLLRLAGRRHFSPFGVFVCSSHQPGETHHACFFHSHQLWYMFGTPAGFTQECCFPFFYTFPSPPALTSKSSREYDSAISPAPQCCVCTHSTFFFFTPKRIETTSDNLRIGGVHDGKNLNPPRQTAFGNRIKSPACGFDQVSHTSLSAWCLVSTPGVLRFSLAGDQLRPTEVVVLAYLCSGEACAPAWRQTPASTA